LRKAALAGRIRVLLAFFLHEDRHRANEYRMENPMGKLVMEPGLTEDGVRFSVEVDAVERECLILKSALAHLSRLQGFTMDFMNTYRACEARIHSVARRLAASGVRDTPLVLSTACFT
jgi:hypothetical protein